MAGVSGGQARVRIKGHRHSVIRFFLVGVGYTMVWITLSSELGYYSKLYQPQVLLQLNIAYYLPTIPVLILSGHLESLLNSRLGECTSMFSRLLLGLTGCAVICAYFPFQPQRLSVLLGLVAALGATSAVAFGTSYQLVAWFRAADTIALGLGCVGSGPLALLLQLGLGMTGDPLRWQWIAMFEVAAAFVVLGILAALSLLWQYGKIISGQESYLDAPLLQHHEGDDRMTPEQQLEESTMRMMLPIRMFSVADPFQGMPLPPSTGLEEAMAEQPWRRLRLLRRVQSAAFSEDLTPLHSRVDGPMSAEGGRTLRKVETMTGGSRSRTGTDTDNSPLQATPVSQSLTRARSSPREHSRHSSLGGDVTPPLPADGWDPLPPPSTSPTPTPPSSPPAQEQQPGTPPRLPGGSKSAPVTPAPSPFGAAALVAAAEADQLAVSASLALVPAASAAAAAPPPREQPPQAPPRGPSFTFTTLQPKHAEELPVVLPARIPDPFAPPPPPTPQRPSPFALAPAPRSLPAGLPSSGNGRAVEPAVLLLHQARSSPFFLAQASPLKETLAQAQQQQLRSSNTPTGTAPGLAAAVLPEGQSSGGASSGGLKKAGSATLRDIEEAVPLLQALDNSKEHQIGSIRNILGTVWMLVLGSLVSNIIFTVAFPFFTFAKSSGWLGDRLPQALFYTRIFADILGRLLPRRKALSLRQPAAVLVLASFKVAVVVLYFLYLKAPAHLLHDIIPLVLVAILWSVGGYINTNGYIMAPNMVAPKEVSVVSNMMVLTYKVAHFTGLLLAVAIAEAIFGGVAGDL